MKINSTVPFLRDILKTGSFVALDTETTGLSASAAEVIEIGAVRFENWQETAEFSHLIKPKKSIPYSITRINGISNKMVAEKPAFCEVLDDFMDFIAEGPIIGHNISFDYSFLCSGGAPLDSREIQYADTLYLARKILPRDVKIENHQLGTLCRYYGVVNKNAHRATDDARATALVLRGLLGDMNFE